MKKISFVCTGNTCRSAMAECIFKHLCKQNDNNNFTISSYGISAKNGEEINPLAKQVLSDYKIRYKSHKAKKLTDKIIKKQDIIFVMTNEQKNILKRYENVLTIAEFVDGIDIPDPYGLGYKEYEAIFKLLYASLKKIYSKLNALEELWK